jgi:two-component system, cell cycle sensor histidine kinase and response regulator CckA
MIDLPSRYQTRKTTRRFMASLVAVVLLVDFFVIALGAVFLRQSRIQYMERAAVQAQNLSQTLVYSIAGIIDTTDVALLSVADEAERALLLGGSETRSMNAIIARQHGRLPALDSIRITNAKGEVLYGVGVVAGMAISAADRDYFLQLRDNPQAGLVISKPVVGRISGKWVVIVARRINKPDGSFGGVVYGPIALERIRSMLNSVDVGPNGRISLRDRDKGIIVRFPAAKGGVNDIGRKPKSPEMLRRFGAGETSGTFYTSTSSDNTERLVSYRKIAAYPLYLSVALSPGDYLAPWWRDLTRISVLVGLFVMVTLLLSRLVFQRWRREREAEKALLDSKEELERRVVERTGELFQANARLTTELVERQRAEESLRQGRNMLAQIINSIPQHVFWKNRDSVYLGCNIVFARAAGVALPEEIVGRTDYEMPWLPEESRDYRRDDREVMEHNRPSYHIVEQQLQADGARLWVDTTKIPLSNEKGEVYGILGVYENITERKEVEDSRNKALAFIESLLASTPTGTFVYDGVTGDCVMVNRSAAEMLGGTISELRAQNFRNLKSWQEAGFDLIAEEVLRDSVTRHLEKSLRTTFGKAVDLDCFLSKFDVEGHPHLMFISVDISGKKRLEQENKLIEAQMLHVQKLESLGIMAGGIAHDFNNILMVVLGNADLALMRLAPDSPARENLEQIEHAASRAADLARQMLAYSGKGRFVIENLDLTRIVAEMAQMLEVSISKKVVLRYDFAKDLPAINGDATQLRQVILNLVINASEAIGDNSGVIAISTSSMECDRAYLTDAWIDDRLPEGQYLILEVADTGCGIDPEIIPKIFDPFFTTKFTGRGLGMAAVLGIVRGHKGAIKIRSEKGKGTTFKLLIPALQVAADRQLSSVYEGLWKGRGTVLLVDDEENIRSIGEEMLQALGFQVLTASDGRDAIEVFARNEEISCVLLDLTMPELDGEQTLRELRRLKPEVRVIISSGYNEQEVSERFVGKDQAGFIQKPYNLAEMSRKLRDMLEGQ